MELRGVFLMGDLRRFVQLDVPTGDVVSTLTSNATPGADPASIPAHIEEVTDYQDAETIDWLQKRWNGSEFEDVPVEE